jgi:transcription termination factor Rho
LLQKKLMAIRFSVSVFVPLFEGQLALVVVQPQGGKTFEV